MYFDVSFRTEVIESLVAASVETQVQQLAATIFFTGARQVIGPAQGILSPLTQDVLTGQVFDPMSGMPTQSIDTSARYLVTEFRTIQVTVGGARSEVETPIVLRSNPPAGNQTIAQLPSGFALTYTAELIIVTEHDASARRSPLALSIECLFQVRPPITVSLVDISLLGTSSSGAVLRGIPRLSLLALCRTPAFSNTLLCQRVVGVLAPTLVRTVSRVLDGLSSSIAPIVGESLIPNAGFTFVTGTGEATPTQLRYRAQLERRSIYFSVPRPADRDAVERSNQTILSEWNEFYRSASPLVFSPGKNFVISLDEVFVMNLLATEFADTLDSPATRSRIANSLAGTNLIFFRLRAPTEVRRLNNVIITRLAAPVSDTASSPELAYRLETTIRLVDLCPAAILDPADVDIDLGFDMRLFVDNMGQDLVLDLQAGVDVHDADAFRCAFGAFFEFSLGASGVAAVAAIFANPYFGLVVFIVLGLAGVWAGIVGAALADSTVSSSSSIPILVNGLARQIQLALALRFPTVSISIQMSGGVPRGVQLRWSNFLSSLPGLNTLLQRTGLSQPAGISVGALGRSMRIEGTLPILQAPPAADRRVEGRSAFTAWAGGPCSPVADVERRIQSYEDRPRNRNTDFLPAIDMAILFRVRNV